MEEVIADIGTYGSSIYPFFPYKVMPEPGDLITWDWMDVISQFSQRYLKYATFIGTFSQIQVATLDYSALRCDFFPPYIKAYFFDSSTGKFKTYNPWSDNTISSDTPKGYTIFDVGLGTCKMRNDFRADNVVYHVIAYL